MNSAFFVSGIGDTDLAKGTIERYGKDKILLIPLTKTAADRTKDVLNNEQITRITVDQITEQADTLLKNTLDDEELKKIETYIHANKIQHIYIGVASNDNEIPFQIAERLSIPCTIAYEYMFRPAKHSFWDYIKKGLAEKENINFAVPLDLAKQDILDINEHAKVKKIGHLSIDRSQQIERKDLNYIKEMLGIKSEEELAFISGTTQPTEVDDQFIKALLSELATGNYPNLQLRIGLHPGVKDPDAYLQTILNTCELYSETSKQFQIILTPEFEKRLTNPILPNKFILQKDISGPDAAQAADRVAQAVPGALLNEAAMQGKPAYFNDQSATPYLPRNWFANSIGGFFAAKPQQAHTREDLDLENDTAPALLAQLMGLQ